MGVEREGEKEERGGGGKTKEGGGGGLYFKGRKSVPIKYTM